MRTPVLAALLLAGATALPVAAQAQQRIIVEEGVTTGLSGPGVGIISEDVVPSLRRYVVEERIPSYTVDAPVRGGTVLPEAGVTYYDVPQQFGATLDGGDGGSHLRATQPVHGNPQARAGRNVLRVGDVIV